MLFWEAKIAKHLQRPTRRLPVFFEDVELLGGWFDAKSEVVRKFLPPEVQLIETRPGRFNLSVIAADYRVTDLISPYTELSIAAPVRHKSGLEALFPIEALINTEEACWTARAFCGVPASKGDLSLGPRDGMYKARLVVEGAAELELRTTEAPADFGVLHLDLLTSRNDRCFTFELDFSGALSHAAPIWLALGEGAIAEQLRSFDVALRSVKPLHLREGAGTRSGGQFLGMPSRKEIRP